ncbi:S-methyl-5'-thioadenosine phosphorylase [Patescibacteria group bacterium]|nr:S-methyl-5'-thioadenosine phosphorylase [Patescibacteria group bacterium]
MGIQDLIKTNIRTTRRSTPRNLVFSLRSKIREIPDWPEKGVSFKDITPLLQDKDIFGKIIDELAKPYLGKKIDKIVGIDARGFILASALAYKLKTGLAIVRKKGKLPFKAISKKYSLEYASNILEMHEDAILPGEKVLIIDDVLATGGTMEATVDLVKKLKGKIVGIDFLIELDYLNGRKKLKRYKVKSLVGYKTGLKSVREKRLAEIGIIGGSGFYEFFDKNAKEIEVETKFGKPSDKITIGNLFGRRVAFLPRHGKNHQIPPHKIPYRANIAALKEIGVEKIIAPSAVGSLRTNIKPGDFVICDQFVDRTKLREDTFFDGPKVAHIEATYPYCKELRKIAVSQAKKLSFAVHSNGTVVVIEGPKFSTLAESAWFSKMGWDVVNMTQYPEVILALELGVCYLNISLVTDYDSGIYAKSKIAPVSIEQVLANFSKNTEKLKRLIGEVIKKIPKKRKCDCQKKSKRASV